MVISLAQSFMVKQPVTGLIAAVNDTAALVCAVGSGRVRPRTELAEGWSRGYVEVGLHHGLCGGLCLPRGRGTSEEVRSKFSSFVLCLGELPLPAAVGRARLQVGSFVQIAVLVALRAVSAGRWRSFSGAIAALVAAPGTERPSAAQPERADLRLISWWSMADSNRRPLACQARAGVLFASSAAHFEIESRPIRAS